MTRRTCWHGRTRGDCFLCRMRIRGDDYWHLVKECRKRRRKREHGAR